MEIVVDANVLLAAFLKDATTRELLFDARLNLFAPEHLVLEISKNLGTNPKIRKRIHLSSDELQELFSHLTQRIQTVAAASYKRQFREAFLLAPHKEDSPYFALALLLGIPIWSNDKAFKEQGKIKIYATGEIIEHLGRRLE